MIPLSRFHASKRKNVLSTTEEEQIWTTVFSPIPKETWLSSIHHLYERHPIHIHPSLPISTPIQAPYQVPWETGEYIQGYEHYGPLPPRHTYHQHTTIPEPSNTEIYDIVNAIHARKRAATKLERKERAKQAREAYDWIDEQEQLLHVPLDVEDDLQRVFTE
jgi:hypothetical protein